MLLISPLLIEMWVSGLRGDFEGYVLVISSVGENAAKRACHDETSLKGLWKWLTNCNTPSVHQLKNCTKEYMLLQNFSLFFNLTEANSHVKAGKFCSDFWNSNTLLMSSFNDLTCKFHGACLLVRFYSIHRSYTHSIKHIA